MDDDFRAAPGCSCVVLAILLFWFVSWLLG